MIIKVYKNQNIDLKLNKKEGKNESKKESKKESTNLKNLIAYLLREVPSMKVVSHRLVNTETNVSYVVNAKTVARLNDGKRVKLVAEKAIKVSVDKQAEAPKKKSVHLNKETRIPSNLGNPLYINNGFKLGKSKVTFLNNGITMKKRGKPARFIRLGVSRVSEIYNLVNGGKITEWKQIATIISRG